MRTTSLKGAQSPSKRWKVAGVFFVVHYFAGGWVMLATPFLLFFGVGWSLAYPFAWLMFGLFWMLWAPLAIALHLLHMPSIEVEMARVAGSLLYTALFYQFHAPLGQVWRWLGATLHKPLRLPHRK